MLGPRFPALLPELMAYQATIVRVSQEFAGLAWVRYDQAFRRQAAIQGNRQWSVINSTMYTMCFTGNACSVVRCDLCLSASHTSADCALRGESNPGMRARVKAVEAVVVALSGN